MSDQSTESPQETKPIKERINCPCGGRYTWNNKSRHCGTKLHKQYLAKLEEEFKSDDDGYVSDSTYCGGFSCEYMEEYDYLFYNGDDRD